MYIGTLYYSNGFWLVEGDSEYPLHPTNIGEIDLILENKLLGEIEEIYNTEPAYRYVWEDSQIEHVNRYGKRVWTKCLKMKKIEEIKSSYGVIRNRVIANYFNGLEVEYSLEFESLPSQIFSDDVKYKMRDDVHIDVHRIVNLPNPVYTMVPDEFRKNKKNPTKEDLFHYAYENYYIISNYKTTRIVNAYAKVKNLTYLI
jgi:hypothetical protein